jgi:hypothetical protein
MVDEERPGRFDLKIFAAALGILVLVGCGGGSPTSIFLES